MAGRLRGRRRFTAALTVLAVACGLAGAASAAQADTSVTVDGSSPGLVFAGDGAISGGGGNSRLLTDYPQAQRDAVLDYMFKPGYGAQVQILKLELGGSGNSTSGSESSFEETKGDINCDAGYELWLGAEAQKRNPDIVLYGLTWSAPAWVGSTFYNANGIQYILDWLGCAKQHGLRIGYMGGWNEHGYDANWFPQLRSALDSNGYTGVKIVSADANDSGWSTANGLASNPAFKAATDVVGNHYPCSPYTGTSSYTQCTSTATAQGLGLPLWSSEEGSLDYNVGGAPMARTDNLVYLQGRMVANINWPILGAVYPDVSFAGQGIMTADQPWSGHYSVGLSTWAMAQTTQFAQPGWQYLDSGSGYLGGSTYTQGSYVSLKSPDNSDWSTIVETTRASGPQTVTFKVQGGLSTGTVHVWSTDLSSSDQAKWFVHDPDVTPDATGQFTVTLQPNQVYSLTTTTGQGKGDAANPPAADLRLPYTNSFDADAVNSQPQYMGQMEGALDVQPCAGRSGQCVQQETPARPLEWGNFSSSTFPYTAGGDAKWANYQVSADVMNKVPGSVGIVGRQQSAGSQVNAGEDPTHVNGYWLSLSDAGAWSLRRSNFSSSMTSLASGTVAAAAGLGTWHKLALTFDGSTIIASIDGATVGSVTDATYGAGKVGLFTGRYTAGDQFDDLAVTPLNATAVPVTLPSGDGTHGTVSVPYDTVGGGVDQWTYAGSWQSGGGNTWSNAAGDTATLRFQGTGVTLYGVAYNGQGIESVSVDGGPATSVDLYLPTSNGVPVPVFNADGLDPTATHTLKVTVTGTKNPSSTGAWASVASAVVVLPPSAAPAIVTPTSGSTIEPDPEHPEQHISGTAPPGSLVTVTANGTSICGLLTASGTGAWSCEAALPAGAMALVAESADPVTGDLSAPSAPTNITVAGATSATGDVGGSVTATLMLSLGSPADFGSFVPGVARDYTASTTATVASSAGDAVLSVSDPDSAHPGHLLNGSFALAQAVQAHASSAGGTSSGPLTALGASPLALLSYAKPVGIDSVAIDFKQSIGASDPLRTGAYSKTLTFTLSTDQP